MWPELAAREWHAGAAADAGSLVGWTLDLGRWAGGEAGSWSTAALEQHAERRTGSSGDPELDAGAERRTGSSGELERNTGAERRTQERVALGGDRTGSL